MSTKYNCLLGTGKSAYATSTPTGSYKTGVTTSKIHNHYIPLPRIKVINSLIHKVDVLHSLLPHNKNWSPTWPQESIVYDSCCRIYNYPSMVDVGAETEFFKITTSLYGFYLLFFFFLLSQSSGTASSLRGQGPGSTCNERTRIPMIVVPTQS